VLTLNRECKAQRSVPVYCQKVAGVVVVWKARKGKVLQAERMVSAKASRLEEGLWGPKEKPCCG
jgi:hypothetical protein